ncbi:sensor histidine kinase [Lentilactobacillus kisonensis]|uniref:histidine kinase n=1 Tax=Lentilactobacillus kisonensis F0435 TaxID=797516 RepID=H1LI07_9LACO|nr:HAMP domain-containing sensor histidine kinase [Lentilactobacillus kisonensis]EHO50042.1 ATPase/histidine kinase/DNA gyrase B/HSP90 domain protein [Lentilactobacillus kisonensis F0435]
MTVVLIMICIVLMGIIGIMITEVRRINRELNYINAHDTNAEVTTNTGWPLFSRLAQSVNFSLIKTRAARLKQVEQEKQIKQMLTNLTHDIKTPLTVAIGYIQLLDKNRQNNDNHHQYQRIENNLLEVNYYLHYLMDFNLLQEKNAQLSLSEVDVSKALEGELFNYYDDLTAKGLEMTINIKPAVTIQTDKTLLERVFQNLISNLLKYADGQVVISLQEKDATHFQITFKNQTARPLLANRQSPNRFVTEDVTQTNQSVGLGLDIVRSLITTLGGRFRIQHEDGYFVVMLTFRYQAG